MANDPNDSYRLPGPGERIRRLGENPVPTGGVPMAFPGQRLAFAGGYDDEVDGGEEHHDGHHPTALTYVIVGAILTLITAVEVSAYYIPAWSGSAIYVPSMLLLSAVKFVTVVMFYMHLKYDHKLFRALFTGPFLIAFATLFGLMFLFGKLAIRLGILS
jgi:cytochrome c oxidase subunit 4